MVMVAPFFDSWCTNTHSNCHCARFSDKTINAGGAVTKSNLGDPVGKVWAERNNQ